MSTSVPRVPFPPPGSVPLPGSERHPEPKATLLGAADPGERASAIVMLRRRPDAPAQSVADVYAAAPIGSRVVPTEEEFAAAFGADPADILAVTDFATANGLAIEEVHAASRTITVSGTIAQLQQAFGVALHRYSVERTRGKLDRLERFTDTYRGLDGPVHLPAKLAGVVTGVFGLDNRNITKHAGSGDPAGTGTLTVPEVARLYHVPTNLAEDQTIAILSFAGYLASDVQQSIQAQSPGAPPPQIVDVGTNGVPDTETTQDICIAAMAAPGATIAVYFGTTGDEADWIRLLKAIAWPPPGTFPPGVARPSVASTSYYISNGDDDATLARDGISLGFVFGVSSGIENLIAAGVTFCTVTGDYGVDLSSYGGATSDGKQHVAFPASSPWALACGGTTIGNVDVAAGTFEEVVWNDVTNGTQLATGGGVSSRFAIPSYQANVQLPKNLAGGRAGRGIPDVSANASVNSGYVPIFVRAPVAYVGNGTSAAAPLIAGLIAVVNAALSTFFATRVTLGFFHPQLYRLGTTVCRDVGSPPGPATNGINGVPGYPAGPGWDACTGWGVLDGQKLFDALAVAPEPAAFCSTIIANVNAVARSVTEGLRVTPAAWEALERQLGTCRHDGYITQAQYDTALATIARARASGPQAPVPNPTLPR